MTLIFEALYAGMKPLMTPNNNEITMPVMTTRG